MHKSHFHTYIHAASHTYLNITTPFHNLTILTCVQIVTIKDARLGLLHYGFMLGIVVYILVFTVLIEQRYLPSSPFFPYWERYIQG
jgi:hypothetical protein